MNRPIHPHSWRQSYVLLFLGVMLVAWFALPQTAAARTFDPGHLVLDDGNTYTDNPPEDPGSGVQNDCHYLQNCGNSQSSSSGSSQGSSNSNPWPTGCCRPGS